MGLRMGIPGIACVTGVKNAPSLMGNVAKVRIK
jgi:hypothetical protein